MQPQNQQFMQPITFDLVQSDMAARNYLVAPGNLVFLLDRDNKVLYEKTYNNLIIYDLDQRASENQNGSENAITREEIAQMIANALSQYNPHIPKKERKNG